MGKGKDSRSRKVSKRNSISIQLLSVEIPMIAFFIIVVAIVMFVQARNGLIEEAIEGLKSDSKASALEISGNISRIVGYYSGIGDMLTQSELKTDEKIWEAEKIALGKFDEAPSGCYIGFEDKTFVNGYFDAPDAKPSDDYDPTQRGWYEMAKDSEEILMGEAYDDAAAGGMVVTIARRVDMPNGKMGVLGADLILTNVEQKVTQYQPGGSGHAILFDGSMILACAEEGYTGTDAADHASDSFINALATAVSSGKSDVLEIKGNDGDVNLVSFDNVPGTSWTMVSYVSKKDILTDLNLLRNFTIILVAFALIICTAVITGLVNRVVTNPVKDLTENIVRIADGDFSVDIEKGGNNEIGIMNDSMSDYVGRMRSTLGEMKSVTQLLSEEADNSKTASDSLNSQAMQQSNSMDEIQRAMEGVAQSVTDLASNATELSQSVSDMTSRGDATNATMEALLAKARQGQQDMSVVQNNMDSISTSMSEMNAVVKRVGKATEQINSIVDMINSISSQTNLLSLNASIEAARAGEAGKGFAVVAGEIGNLAGESANATREIAGIIEDVTKEISDLSQKSEASVNEIEASSEAVSTTGTTFEEIFTTLNEAGHSIRDMISQMEKVSDIANSVASIAEEQSSSTQAVTNSVDSATSSAQNVASESRSVDSSAITVADSAAKIEEFVDTFTL